MTISKKETGEIPFPVGTEYTKATGHKHRIIRILDSFPDGENRYQVLLVGTVLKFVYKHSELKKFIDQSEKANKEKS